jgi:uncharacterized membrane protein YkoI
MKFINGKAKWALAAGLIVLAAGAGLAIRTAVRKEGLAKEERALYQSSIQVLNGKRSGESADLQSLAHISPDEVRTAALAQIQGTAKESELKNEDGNLIYSVEVASNGGEQEATIDAGNGRVLRIERDDD